MKSMFKLFALLSLSLFSCSSHIKFDSKKWKEGGVRSIMNDTRLNMSKDLIDSRILINKSELELTALLGPPSYLGDYEPKKVMYFAVKEEYSWNIDPEN